MKDRKETCRDCKHFLNKGLMGECRINPPFLDDKMKAAFPRIAPTGWCGQHESKRKVQ